jgi:methionine-rich copper-binding protein CopC
VHNLTRRAGLLVVLVLGVGVLGTGPASAHAALVGSDPKDGSSQASAPQRITFTFNENIGHAQVAGQAPDGSALRVSAVKTLDHTVSATIADPGQRGKYSLSYRVVSADGHPVSGTVSFTTTAGRAVTQVDQADSETFLHRHSSHLFWGILAAAVAVALLLAPLRRRDDADRS